MLRSWASPAKRAGPAVPCLSIPTRPPAESRVRPPDTNIMVRSHQTLSEYLERVEFLVGYEGTQFTATEGVGADLLGITSVHPMREDAVDEMLTRADSSWSVVQGLITEDKLAAVEYERETFYIRRLRRRPGSESITR